MDFIESVILYDGVQPTYAVYRYSWY